MRSLPRVVVIAPGKLIPRLLLTGAEFDGSTIPEVVLVVPEAEVAAGATSEPTEIADGGAPRVAEEVRDDVLPWSNLEVVVRSLEIQDAEPICDAPGF
jgi:hypothetical protein